MLRILITGGSGFIGTNLLEFYLNKNLPVINLDIHSPANISHKKYWVDTDIMNKADLVVKVKTFAPTHIIHLAARTDLMGETLEAYSVNTTGTENIIEAALQVKDVKRVIFTSSMLVCRVGYIPKDYEDYNPVTPYGKSKMNMELLIKNRNLPFEHIVIRPTSIWGPWFATPYRDFFDMVHTRKYINIGNSTISKTYGFILNSVFQIDQLLFKENLNKRTFYIGDDPPIVLGAWANAIAAKLGNRAPLQLPYSIFKIAAFVGDGLKKLNVKFPITSFRLKNMTTNNVLSLHDLYAITGPAPYSLDEGIDITLKWLNYKKN